MSTTVIIAAAGRGERLSSDRPKQFVHIAGKPILYYAMRPFDHCRLVDHLVVVVPAGYETHVEQELVHRFAFEKVARIVAGGRRRQDSVRAGLDVLPEGTELVAIHDGARPFVTTRMILAVLKAGRQHGAAIPGLAPKDTIKQTSEGNIATTLDRTTLVAVQTPQVFLRRIIEEAYRRAFSEDVTATDDAALVEEIGHEVHLVEGDPVNIKVTTRDDLAFAEWLVAEGKWGCE